MKKYFVPMFFLLLGCGQHTFDNVFDDFFGTSSSSDFSSSSSEISSSSRFSLPSSFSFPSSSSFHSSSSSLGSSSSSAQSINYEQEEAKLYDLIMQYRAENGLPIIPQSKSIIPKSKSLTYVAQVHVKDLQENYFSYDASCNLHSWSNNGDWTPCCYTSYPDEEQKKCMWEKAGEMTSYVGTVYEIATKTNASQMTAEKALDAWKNSPSHNDVILNDGPWEFKTWNVIGIGIYGAFAAVWFGEELDDKDGKEFKLCLLDWGDLRVCFPFSESITLKYCKSLFSDGYRPAENPPANCLYL